GGGGLGGRGGSASPPARRPDEDRLRLAGRERTDEDWTRRNGMRFALRRLAFFALTLWVALTLNFLLPRMMPGNPAVSMIAKFRGGVSPEALKALEAQFGVNSHQSLISEYFSYLGNMATGKFGTSLSEYPASVAHIVFNAI